MKWTFTYQNDPHEAEWQKGAMRCTMPEVISKVDEIIFDGGLVPCGSAVNLVEPTLETEAGGFAVITLAIQQYADFMSLKMPLSDATVITDVIFEEEFDKAKSFGGDRSAAGRYAAQMRWGNRTQTESAGFDPSAVPLRNTETADGILDAMYPEGGEAVIGKLEMIAVVAYQTGGAGMNTNLRNGEVKSDAEYVDRAFDSATPLSTDMVFHRGLDIGRMSDEKKAVDAFHLLKVGDSFSDAGFVSTSTSLTLAREWGGSSGIRFEIVTPKGSKVLPMNAVLGKKSFFPEEHEVVLPRGAKFKVIGMTDERNQMAGRAGYEKAPNYVKILKVVMETEG